jgi:murein DD-endopeptidase MepM/ murein hydrolase activator NlpD
LRIAIALLCVATLSPVPRAADAIRVSAAARSTRPGEIVLFTVTPPARTTAVTLHVFDRVMTAYDAGSGNWRALVGIDLDVKPAVYPVLVDARGASRSATTTTYDMHVGARTFPTRRLRVNDAFVNPPADVEARIARESAQIAAVYGASAPERLWNGAFVRPVPGPANSRFGTRSIFNGQPRNPHAGGDFLSPAGTPVKAPNAGRIVIAQDLYFSGNTVIIDHGLGLFSMLAHLSVIDVRAGDRVRAGDIVGKVGATGRVTGPHLHWAVRASGARVDPLSLLALLGPPADRARATRRRR